MERGRKKERKKEKEKEKSVRKQKIKKSDLSILNLVVEFGVELFCALFSKTCMTFSYEVRIGSASTQMKASDEPHLNSCRR